MHFHTTFAALTAGLILAAWPLIAGAQELSVDQVQQTFVDQGYTVDAPAHWADGVQMLAIHDASVDEQPGWPTLRAFVYTDRSEAPAQILSGYGSPTWRDNVAIIRYDPTAFQPEPDCRPAEFRL